MTIYWKFWENFRNFWKFFFGKLQEMHYFRIFFKYVNKLCVHFLSVWTKNSNCWEILGKFWNFLIKMLRKIEFFIFFIFIFFKNLLLKIELSEITPFFYNNFFGFGGGGISPLPLGYALASPGLHTGEGVIGFKWPEVHEKSWVASEWEWNLLENLQKIESNLQKNSK